MANNLTVAWAMPVDAVPLGASIEAYASMRSTESAFLKFIETTPDSSVVRRLPAELLEQITKHAYRMHYLEHKSEWKEAWYCHSGNCSLHYHFDEEKYESNKAKYMKEEGIEEESEFDSYMFGEWLQECRIGTDNWEHLLNIKTMQLKIGEYPNPDFDDARFKHARKLFAKDFGLEVHFQTFNLDPLDPRGLEPSTFEDRWILAYLTLPARYGVMQSATAGSFTSLHAAMIINTATRNTPAKEQRELFPKALRALSLEPYSNGMWTESRPTSERYKKTNSELQDIQPDMETIDPFRGLDEAYWAHTEKSNSTKWPQLLAFASNTHCSEM